MIRASDDQQWTLAGRSGGWALTRQEARQTWKQRSRDCSKANRAVTTANLISVHHLTTWYVSDWSESWVNDDLVQIVVKFYSFTCQTNFKGKISIWLKLPQNWWGKFIKIVRLISPINRHKIAWIFCNNHYGIETQDQSIASQASSHGLTRSSVNDD